MIYGKIIMNQRSFYYELIYIIQNNGSAYYMVETSIDASGLINELGEEAALKVGMLCETKIVVEEKRVLEVLVEKLFHLTD